MGYIICVTVASVWGKAGIHSQLPPTCFLVFSLSFNVNFLAATQTSHHQGVFPTDSCIDRSLRHRTTERSERGQRTTHSTN